MATALQSFPAFDVNEDQTSSIHWKKWLQRFENLIVALDMKDDTRTRAKLLHYAGDGVQNIFDTLPDTGEAKDDKCATDKLSTFSLKSTLHETYKFRQAQQLAGETLDSYH